MWFSKLAGDTHKEHIECFYGPQAHAWKLFFYLLPVTFPKKFAHFSFVFLGLRGLGFRVATFALV